MPKIAVTPSDKDKESYWGVIISPDNRRWEYDILMLPQMARGLRLKAGVCLPSNQIKEASWRKQKEATLVTVDSEVDSFEGYSAPGNTAHEMQNVSQNRNNPYVGQHRKGSAAQWYQHKTSASVGSHLPGWQTTTNKKSAYFDSEKDVLWMKKRQGKICPIDTTGRVSSYLGSHQQLVNDVIDQLPAPSSSKN